MNVLERSEREARIFELRSRRMSWTAIGKELGLSHTRVIQIFEAARDRIPASRLADLRAESTELADRAIANLLEIAEDKTISPRTRVEAWNAIRGYDESLRKLYGADAPQRKEITVLTDDVIDSAIKKLTEEMEALDAQAELAVEKLIEAEA
jgi:predicted transcriptional regulator